MKTTRATRLPMVLLAAISVAAVVGAAPAARGEEGAEQVEARRLFEEGVRLFADERYPAALAAFRESYRLRESRTVLYNMGMCLQTLFNYPEAIDVFEEYLRRWGDEVDAPRRAAVQSRIAEMRGHLLYVTVEVGVDGAEVLVDGNAVGRSPLADPIRLAPGTHSVEVRAAGHRPARESVTVTEPGARTLRLQPEPLVERGTLSVEADAADAVLYVDGEEVGALPQSVELVPGPHTVEVRAPDMAASEQEIELEAGQELRVDLHLEPAPAPTGSGAPWYRRHWWIWVVVGVAVAGSVAAGVAVPLTRDDDFADWDVRLR